MLQRILLTISFFILVIQLSSAQQVYNKNEIGINLGASFYQGDLTANAGSSFAIPNFAGEIYYSRFFNSYLFGRFNIMAGRLHGDDALNRDNSRAYMQQRMFRFSTPIVEASLMGGYNFFGNNFGDRPFRFSPYVMAGIGAAYVDVSRDWSRMDTNLVHAGSPTMVGLIADATQPTSRLSMVVPVAVGIKYALTPRFSLAAEAKYRFTTTDYLDGFSYSANPDRKDSYFSLMAGVSYNFGKAGGFGKNNGGVGCPKF